MAAAVAYPVQNYNSSVETNRLADYIEGERKYSWAYSMLSRSRAMPTDKIFPFMSILL